MEALYNKLYEKYNKLKTRKVAEMDQFNQEQEAKFMNYVSAAEELIEHLRSENDRLKSQIHDLTNEVASVRSDKVELHAKYTNLLVEEAKKTKELSNEVKRLQNLQEEGLCCISKQRNNKNSQFGSPPGASQVGSQGTSKGSSRKKRRVELVESQSQEGNLLKDSLVTDLERDSCQRPLSDDVDNILQTNCSLTKSANSGDCLSANSLFQTLIECLVGLKFASVSETEGLCLSASHQSSGYSFSLTWLSKGTGEEEAELLYHVASLGTFERVAPGWMKEDLMFSTSMCPVFFKRVSQVIGLHY